MFGRLTIPVFSFSGSRNPSYCSPQDIINISVELDTVKCMTHHEPKKEEKKEEKASVEPIKPGDPRVVRKSSLLDTCYTTSSGKK